MTRASAGDRPQLSLIVVTCNSRNWIGDCLDSVEAARGQLSCETLVVDSASEDDTAGLVNRHWPEVRVIRMAANRGYAAALNTGIAAARGETLALANADIRMEPGCLETLAVSLDAHTSAAAAGPMLLDGRGSRWPSARGFPSLLDEIFEMLLLHRLWKGNPIGRRSMRRDLTDAPPAAPSVCDFVTGALFVTRAHTMAAVGSFDERFFLYFEETDWFRRASKLGLHALYCPEAAARHVGGASSCGRLERRPYRLRSQHAYHLKHGGRAAQLALGAIQLAGGLLRWAVWSTRLRLGGCDAVELRGRLRRNGRMIVWLLAQGRRSLRGGKIASCPTFPRAPGKTGAVLTDRLEDTP